MSLDVIRERLDATAGPPHQLVKVPAGAVAEVAAGLPDGRHTAISRALLKGTAGAPADAEVWQQRKDLEHLLTRAVA